MLEPVNKKNFKKKIKDKIKDQILSNYQKIIEPELEAFIQTICNKMISIISGKLKNAL